MFLFVHFTFPLIFTYTNINSTYRCQLEGHARPLLREAQCASGCPEEEVQSGYPRMKVRHQYGAKRVFKPLIGAGFFLSAAVVVPSLRGASRLCARRGSDAARGDRRAVRSSPGGRWATGGLIVTHRFVNKETSFFFFSSSLKKIFVLYINPPPPPPPPPPLASPSASPPPFF